MTIIDKLKSLGFATINEGFYGKVQEWKSWYEGDVKGFHRYRVRNGAGIVRCKRYTLNMGKKIPEDWANLLMNERVEITLDRTKEQEFIDRVLEENKDALEYDSIEVDDNVAKISLVGAGMMTHVGVASDKFFGNED